MLATQTRDFSIQVMEVDKDHIHLLVNYTPNVSVAQIVRLLKQMTTATVWFSHNIELKKHFWKQRVFWSSGYFVCSTGDASAETIAKYIEEQG
jgi:putative transposase